ncbi:MAG: YjbQ family protein [Candidatus Aenigmarchaeota archaeon]|nr:YjbQ family protein [Candidatus Aenigmarchaeota archaeon]
MFYRESFEVKLKKDFDFKDITDMVREIVKKSKIIEGLCNIFITGTTAGIIVNENDLMLVQDIKRFFKESIDETRLYHHPSNAHSHLRAMLTDKEVTIPVSDGDLVLGTWQSIMILNFDIRERKRKIIVTVIGD